MKSLGLIGKLVYSQMKLAPGRAIITLVGIIASTCAVVWIVSGYDALVSQFDENAGKYLGRYDALILPAGPPGTIQSIADDLVESLQKDPGVLELNPIQQARVSVTKVLAENEALEETSLGLVVGSKPPVNGAPPIDPILVGTPADEAPYEMVEGTWFDEALQTLTAVVSEGTARELNLAVGDHLLVTTIANQMTLKVEGIVEQAPQAPSLRGGRPGGSRGGPGKQKAASDSTPKVVDQQAETPQQLRHGLPNAYVVGPAVKAVYVRPEIAEQINGFPANPNVLQVSLRDGVELAEFKNVWKEQLAQAKPAVRLVDYDEVKAGLKQTRSLSSQRSQAWAATGMASLAACFIIFSTLSMGVSERAREFAMLRAVALTRLQLAGIITLESLTLAVIGWAGGLFAGWLLLMVGSQLFPGLFSTAPALGTTSLLLTGSTVFVGAFAAAILPAWRAMRIEPIEAMSRQTKPPQQFHWHRWLVVGLVLASVAPASVFLLPMPDVWRNWIYATIAWPALLFGMILLTPAFIVLTERFIGPLLTRLFQLDSRLVRTQLSNNMWRTIGATLSLALGLSLFASTQTWGYSMLQPFLPGKWLPDMLVAFHPIGLDEQGMEQVARVKGVEPNGVLPLAIEQAKFDWQAEEKPAGLRYDNAVLFGFDPERALEPQDPFVSLQFLEGEQSTMAKVLAEKKTCLISEDFQMESGYQVGDQLHFHPPNAPQKRVTYEIAGVVTLPGWHWITKFSGVRRHFVRTETMIFASRENIRRDFGLPRNEFFWLDTDPSVPLQQMEADLQAIAEQDAGATFQTGDVGTVTAYRPFARVTATETVRKAITLRANDMIWSMSLLPLVTLMIMSLAVANAMIASMRSRMWEFGVLRSIGITRWQLVRLILIETMLIGLVACLLSLAFGLTAGWCGVGMARYGGWFAGPPSFLIPWTQLGFGFALTLGLCLLAGLWPAIQAGRSEPLSLLQAGRSSM